MENNNSEEKVIIKYSSYTEAQKRATQKYRQNNKDKINEQRKKYYNERKEKDPDFLKYKREKAKEYYQKKKTNTKTNNEESETLEQINEEFINAQPIELFITEQIPVINEDLTKALDNMKLEKPDNDYIETVEVKPKRKYKKKQPNNELPIIPEEVENVLIKPIRKRKIIKA